MVNISEIQVGDTIYIKEDFAPLIKLINAAFLGVPSDGFGEVVEVEPSSERLLEYPEINPQAITENKVIYYDKAAGRHFLVRVDMIGLVVKKEV